MTFVALEEKEVPSAGRLALSVYVITSPHQDRVEALAQMQTGVGAVLLDLLASRAMTQQTSVFINHAASGI